MMKKMLVFDSVTLGTPMKDITLYLCGNFILEVTRLGT